MNIPGLITELTLFSQKHLELRKLDIKKEVSELIPLIKDPRIPLNSLSVRVLNLLEFLSNSEIEIEDTSEIYAENLPTGFVFMWNGTNIVIDDRFYYVEDGKVDSDISFSTNMSKIHIPSKEKVNDLLLELPLKYTIMLKEKFLES